METNFRKFIQCYKTTAVMLMNICLLFALVNILGFAGIDIRENYFKQKTDVAEKYSDVDLTKVYPKFSSGEIAEIQKENQERPSLYEPFTQFKERPYSGKYVNVSEAGFRFSKDQESWPLKPENFNVFVFGGSTTFNYGLPDDQTIASYLQEYLSALKKEKVAVYNFGRSGYFSTQERILFEQLLVAGHRPDMAIFIDGLNEFYFYQGQPKYTEYFEELQQFVDKPSQAFKFAFASVAEKLPITRLAHFLGKLFAKNQASGGKTEYNDPVVASRVINNYLENKKIIEGVAKAYQVSPIFVWQPVPNYQYDLQYYLFSANGETDFDAHNYAKYGYSQMAEIWRQEKLGNNFFWCADMQEGIKEPLYVDKVHYTAAMSKNFAELIGGLLVERGFLYDSSN